MIQNHETGDLKPELMGERVLSAIIEIQVPRDQLSRILRTVKEVAREVDSVFCLDVITMLEPGLTIPKEVLQAIRAEGLTWRPNAKINQGLGRAWEKEKS
jgi:Trm5-related predicted tRNA methylase